MLTRTLICGGLLSIVLGGASLAEAIHTPSSDQLVTDKTTEVRKLLGEARAARGAIRRDERRAARDIVRDALALEARIAGTPPIRRYALLESGTGTVEEVSRAAGSPVVEVYDRFSEKVMLDLVATRHDLERARLALAAGRMREADRELARIGNAMAVADKLTPEPGERAAANIAIAAHEFGAGDWHAGWVAIDGAIHDGSSAPVAPPSPAGRR